MWVQFAHRDTGGANMCTAIAFYNGNGYFGRTLDYEKSFGESIVVTPRNFKFPFHTRHAIIGVAHESGGYPLYYDAINEAGLGMAGLNFEGNAHYNEKLFGRQNVASYHLIPFVLGQCSDLVEAKVLLEDVNVTSEAFHRKLPPTPLHWMVTDGVNSLVVEQTKEGMYLYDNPIGVLTNNPPFPYQRQHLCQYLNVTSRPAENRFSEEIALKAYSRGMGAIGLPGDVSSPSRFVRAAFTKLNSVCGDAETENVNQFFHILGTVDQVRGCVKLEENVYEMTIYTSCYNLNKGHFYYKTYDDFAIKHVNMKAFDLNGRRLYCQKME